MPAEDASGGRILMLLHFMLLSLPMTNGIARTTISSHPLFVPSPLSAATAAETVVPISTESIATFSRRFLAAVEDESVSGAALVYQKRKDINELYSDFDNGKYGSETRSIIRYKHPDGEERNLCAFSDKNYLLDYYVHNYKLIPGDDSFIEVKYTDKLDLIYQPRSVDDPAADYFEVNCKRPKTEDGYMRLGDMVIEAGNTKSKQALLVKAKGDILAPPTDYEQVWSETVPVDPDEPSPAPSPAPSRAPGFCYDPVIGGCLCNMSGKQPCVQPALDRGGQGSAGDPCLESKDRDTCSNNGLGCRFETVDYFERNCKAPKCETSEHENPGYCYDPVDGGCLCNMSGDQKCVSPALDFGGQGSVGDICLESKDKDTCHSNGLGCRYETAEYFKKLSKAKACGEEAPPTEAPTATPTGPVAPTMWKPVPPEGYVCLGYVWTMYQDKPPTTLIRCVKKDFVESTEPKTKYTSKIGTVWDVGATDNTLASGTFVANDCTDCTAPSQEFHALKKTCIPGYGTAPFCKGEEMSTLEIVGLKKFQIPYARLQPCSFPEEDHTIYGLKNEDAKWEDFAVELFKDDASGFVGYKHYGASKHLGKPHCLGSTAFGSSKLKNDLLIHEVPPLEDLGPAPTSSPTEQGYCYDPVKGGCLCNMSGEQPCVQPALASGGQGSPGDPCLATEDETSCRNNGLGCRFETPDYFERNCKAPPCYALEDSTSDSAPAPPPEGGLISDDLADKLRKGELGNMLSSKISGDFVFLFPCNEENELNEYKTTLQDMAMEANEDGKTENGMINLSEDLGQAAAFGAPKWSTPHYCGQGEEPSVSGACEAVEECIYEKDGCIVYDEKPCDPERKENCGSGFCGDDDLCGENLKLYGDKQKSSFQTLPRSVPYGVEQDGPGNFLTDDKGAKISLYGNTWKAFSVQAHTVTRHTVLEFDFQLDEEGEGHAICLDEDLNEDVEIKGANRCFRLAGTQKQQWSEVWQSPDSLKGLKQFQHYKLEIGSLSEGPAANEPFFPWGTEIQYLALVQDNDANRPLGVSHFRNLQLYENDQNNGAVTDSKRPICDRRQTVNSLWSSSHPNQLGFSSRSIARYQSNNLCVKSNGNEAYSYRMENYKISATDYLEVKYSNSYTWIYDDRGTGADWDFSAWRPNQAYGGWYRLGDVGYRSHSRPGGSAIYVKGGGDILRRPLGYTRIWKDKGSGGKYDGSCWKPTAPSGYTCLGHVWKKDHGPAPSTDYIRCVKTSYTVRASNTLIWKDKGSGADKDVGVWKPVAGGDGLNTEAMVTRGSWSTPSSSEFNVIKRQCTLQYGSFPFCGRMHLVSQGAKTFSVPYARLVPCGFNEEDQTTYPGLTNKDSSHQQYSVELYRDPSTGFIGYKHLETSNRKGRPYCLGTKVFGSSKIRRDVSLKYIYQTGYVSDSTKNNQVNGAYSRSLTQQVGGDFVFMFPCSHTNDIRNHYNYLVQLKNQAGREAIAGVVAGSDDLGQAASASNSNWRNPHYCSCGREPAESGGCYTVADGCYYDPNACPEDSTCAKDGSSCVCRDGYLSELEGTSTLFSHTPGDSCLPAELSLRQEVDGTSFTMNIDNSQNYQRFKIDLKREDGHAPDQAPLSVYAYDGKYATPTGNSKTYKYTFEDLLAGTTYKAKVSPVDSQDRVLSLAVEQETTAATHCCCDCTSSIQGDTSGRPVGFQAYQLRGRVMFNFTDNSRCAEAYAFTRSQVGEEFMDNSDESVKKVFAPNYYYYPKKKCGKAPVLPGTAASDDLLTSKLVVGDPYRYCVRAVAQLYSSTSPQSSDESCQIHHIRWQASLDGEITSAPDAGGLPIEGVTVSWELLNLDQTVVIASGSTVTEKPGKYVIEFDELHDALDADGEMPVRIRFFKRTVVGDQVIQHEFSCNGGFVDCTDDGTVVYLKHLTFEKRVVAYDMTAVPVRGRVWIMEEDGCPVIGADVCLMIKHANAEDTEGACVQTDHNGDYSVVAALGSRVGVEVSYNNHTIVKAPKNALDYEKGLFIDPNKRYERNDFVDTTTATLQIEVAGGLCNKRLGRSEIEVKVNGCEAWEMVLLQQGYKAHHWVPAHVLDVRVTGVTSDEGKAHHRVQEEFAKKIMTKTIDLVTVEEEEEQVEEAETTASETSLTEEEEKLQELEEAEEEEIATLRFQYDGTLQVHFMFLGADMSEECDLDSVTPKGSVSNDPDTTSSLHVTPTGSSFTPLVGLKYELLEDLFCDVVKEDEMSVRVINKVGIDNDFEKYAATIQDETMKTRLQLCSNDVGCNYKIEHDKINGVLSNAKCIPKSSSGGDVIFMAGRPNIHGNFRKDFIVEVLDKDMAILKRHHAQVLVTGDYVTGPGASFALPTYQPIMVLRDPPGGLSYANYENVETTIKAKSSEYEILVDLDFYAALGVSKDNVHSLCKGAIVVYECSEILKYDVGLERGVGYSKTWVEKQDVDVYSTEYTTTWSYTTSDDPLRAGRNSDTIVTPNLHVQYHNVENIKFEADKCTANKKTTVKFALKDPGNQPALSFYTIYNIETLQIPELKTAIANKEREIEEETNNQAKEDATVQLETLTDALSAWTKILHDHNATNSLAKDGKLTIAAREWFEKWAATNETAWESSLPTIGSGDHWSNLAPKSLTDRAVPFDFDYIKEAELETSDQEDIRQTNLIQFSGGGGTVEFLLDHIGVREKERLDSSDDSSVQRAFGDISPYVKFAALGLEWEITAELEAGGEFVESHTVTNEKDHQTSISFVLGDEQKADEFAVEVYIDPKYGTFVFNTVAGVSSQPHEEGTLKGEDIRIKVERPTRPVMPDEPLVFHIDIANYADATNYFNLFLDHTTNKGGLIHRLGGGGLAIAPEFGPFNGEASFTLEVFRGPKGYMFDPSVMQLSGVWDEDVMEGVTIQIYNYIDDDDRKWIRYEEPCPTIEWVGSLKREKKFIVDEEAKPVPLTIFNPRKQDGSLEDIARERRLEHVYVWYRELGSPEWKKAQLEDLTQIDFANITEDDWKEDIYGYASIPWDIAKRLTLNDDGSYEVMIESTCKELPGAPADFNAFSTEPVIVIVDRVKPEMYGSALPIREDVIPGEEVVIMFTEPIDCEIPYRFKMEVRLGGLDDLFDERNLKIYCQERKLAFQFDPTRINYDLLMGRAMTVSIDEVTDLQGNPIKNKIEFKKNVADLAGDDITAEFDIKLDPTTRSSCRSYYTKELEDIQEPVSKLLGLNNPYRVKVKSDTCSGTKIKATVEILPPARRRRLRVSADDDEQELTAMESFYSLLDTSRRARRLAESTNQTDHDGVSLFEVDNLRVIPGEADMKRYSLNMEPTFAEEMILAAGEGCDKHSMQQREHMMRVEQRVTAHLNQTELHMEKDIEILDEKIDHTEHHLESVDQKLDDVLALLSDHHPGHDEEEGPIGSHRSSSRSNSDEIEMLLQELRTERERSRYQMMSSAFVLFASCSILVAVLYQKGRATFNNI